MVRHFVSWDLLSQHFDAKICMSLHLQAQPSAPDDVKQLRGIVDLLECIRAITIVRHGGELREVALTLAPSGDYDHADLDTRNGKALPKLCC